MFVCDSDTGFALYKLKLFENRAQQTMYIHKCVPIEFKIEKKRKEKRQKVERKRETETERERVKRRGVNKKQRYRVIAHRHRQRIDLLRHIALQFINFRTISSLSTIQL